MRGVNVDHYLSITMDGMEKLIDQIGGVDLTVRDDLSSVDERLVKGESVHMDGALALKYVRARRGLNDASNIARMERQKDLMEALVAGLSSDGKKDTDFVGILRKVEDHTTTKCDDVCLGMLEDFFDTYTYLGISALPGEAVKGEVYMEFFVDDDGLEEILKNVFLEKAE
jgi:anionic cell wall polymer biosynthesis LytR-Cps2A-Psr (LCP) family protein